VMMHADAELGGLSNLLTLGPALGPHLVFVEERPLLPASLLGPLLDGEGRLPSSYARLFRLLLWRPGLLGLLRLEADAQLDRYLGRGLPVDFINSHQHTHLFPPLWRALGPVFRRFPRAALRAGVYGALGWSKQGLLNLSARISAAREPLPGQPRVHPLGVQHSGRLTAERLASVLNEWACRPVRVRNAAAEVVTHPAVEDTDLRRRYAHWGFRWQEEYDLLDSNRLRAILDSYAVTFAGRL
jgi:chitin disaccharide deacetylase